MKRTKVNPKALDTWPRSPAKLEITGNSTEEYPGWTGVAFVIDSGASATTIPKGLVEKTKLGSPTGYHSFKLADGSVCNEVLEIRMSVADFAQPLLSVGQMVSAGNRVILSPEMSCGKQKWKDWNGVYVGRCGWTVKRCKVL